MKRVLINFACLLLSLIFSFFIGEVAIRMLYPRIADYNMEMWRYASDLKEPHSDARLPFQHFPNRKGFYYNAELQTNSMGFRDREFSIDKPPGTKRIVMLGDSFTLGWGVPFKDIYSKRLESLLNKDGQSWEVINTGVGNYNTVMEVELFKQKGLKMNPDLVILMYFINDAEPTPKVTTSFKYSLIKHSYLIAFIFDRYIKLKPILNKSYDWKEYYSGLYNNSPQPLAENKQALEELVRLCSDKKIKLLIVNIPELRVLKEYSFPMATHYIKTVAEDGHVPFLDLIDDLSSEEPYTLWVTPEDPHANSKANEIMAQSIYRRLMENPNLTR